MGECYVNRTENIEGKEYSFDSNGHLLVTSLVSDKLIDFIKSWEGFSAIPYRDEVNVLTLGYGMTGEEIQGISEVTEEEATSMLKDWINKKYAPVIKSDLDSKGISLAQNEFDALVSMSYKFYCPEHRKNISFIISKLYEDKRFIFYLLLIKLRQFIAQPFSFYF